MFFDYKTNGNNRYKSLAMARELGRHLCARDIFLYQIGQHLHMIVTRIQARNIVITLTAGFEKYFAVFYCHLLERLQAIRGKTG